MISSGAGPDQAEAPPRPLPEGPALLEKRSRLSRRQNACSIQDNRIAAQGPGHIADYILSEQASPGNK